jgi:hypothetical protein
MASKKAIEAGGAFIRIFADDSPLRRALDGVAKRLKGFATPLIGASKLIGAGLASAGIAAVAATKTFANYADSIGDAAARTGVSATALSELGYAAKLSGSSMEDLEKGLRTLQKGIGSGAANDQLKKLGLDPKEIMAMDPERQFMAVADAIGQIPDQATKTATAMSLLGKSGAQLAPFMSQGGDAINALRQEARDLGVSIGGSEVQAAAAFNDSLDKMFAALQGVAIQIGKVLAPVLTWLADQVLIVAKNFISWLSDVGKFVGSWDTAMATLNLGWTATTNAIIGAWDSTYTQLVSTASSIVINIEGAFDAMGVAILNTWDSTLAKMLSVAYQQTGKIAEPIAEMIEGLGFGDVANTVRGAGVMSRTFGGKAAAQVGAQPEARQAELAQRAAQRQAEIDQIAASQQSELAAREMQRQKEIEEATSALVNSMQNDQKAAEEQAKARSEQAKGAALDMAGIGTDGKGGAESAGTFAAAAIAGLGASSIQLDMLNALIGIKDNTEELVALDEAGGMA